MRLPGSSSGTARAVPFSRSVKTSPQPCEFPESRFSEPLLLFEVKISEGIIQAKFWLQVEPKQFKANVSAQIRSDLEEMTALISCSFATRMACREGLMPESPPITNSERAPHWEGRTGDTSLMSLCLATPDSCLKSILSNPLAIVMKLPIFIVELVNPIVPRRSPGRNCKVFPRKSFFALSI